MKLPVLIPVVLVITCASCTRKAQDRAVLLPADIAVGKASSPNQRFLPTNTGDLAFDTKTGSLCKTWDWGTYEPNYYGQKHTLANQTETCDKMYQWDVREAADQAMAMARAAQEAKQSRNP